MSDGICRAICISTDKRCTRSIMIDGFCITHFRIFNTSNKVNKNWMKMRGNENGYE